MKCFQSCSCGNLTVVGRECSHRPSRECRHSSSNNNNDNNNNYVNKGDENQINADTMVKKGRKINNSNEKRVWIKVNDQNIFVKEPQNVLISQRSSSHFCIQCKLCCMSFSISLFEKSGKKKAFVMKNTIKNDRTIKADNYIGCNDNNKVSNIEEKLDSDDVISSKTKKLPTLDRRMPIEIRPLVAIGQPNEIEELYADMLNDSNECKEDFDTCDSFIVGCFDSLPVSIRENPPPFSCSTSSLLMAFSLE